jgi:hypothetical protein
MQAVYAAPLEDRVRTCHCRFTGGYRCHKSSDGGVGFAQLQRECGQAAFAIMHFVRKRKRLASHAVWRASYDADLADGLLGEPAAHHDQPEQRAQ